jgi:hypothetical protein
MVTLTVQTEFSNYAQYIRWLVWMVTSDFHTAG